MGFRPGVALPPPQSVVRRPEDFGAARDNATDDTQALRDAINDAYAACLADGTFYCEVWLSSGIYLVSSPTVKGGETRGNAQIPLPNREPGDGQKVTIVLKGPTDAGAWVHWQQGVPQRSGAVIRTTLTGQTPDATWGSPSVVGGPTAPLLGGGDFSNIRVIVDGVTVTAPLNPSVIGMDLRRCAQADIENYNALAEGLSGNMANPTNDNGIGLYMPRENNNASAVIKRYGCEGFYYGMGCSDHLTALWLGLIYTNTAIFIRDTTGGGVHGLSILYASIESATTGIQAAMGTTTQFPVHIAQVNAEGVGTSVRDPDSNLRGYIGWTNNNLSEPTVVGAADVKVENLHRGPGAITAPAVPASGAASTPIFKDAAVIVTGGTVSDITVDGQSTGVTSGLVIVPAGKTITLTYTAAPTWRWMLL